jgi:hypothetical protein
MLLPAFCFVPVKTGIRKLLNIATIPGHWRKPVWGSFILNRRTNCQSLTVIK